MALFVYVIESPSALDLLDGRTEGRALCEAISVSGIPYFYSLVTNKETLKIALADRLDTASHNFGSAVPVLHFSMHGNEHGVALTSGDFITWAELEFLLNDVNQKCNSTGMLLCMSTCHGIHAQRMAVADLTRRPFWALVGNSFSTQWSDSAVAYIAFYHRYFKGIGINDCVTAMKFASGDQNFYFTYGEDARRALCTETTN